MTNDHGDSRSRRVTLTALAFLAFVSLGLPDALLGVAWPTMRATFSRPLSSLGLLAACWTTGYFTSSFFAGGIVDRSGVGPLLVGSGAIVAASLALYALAPLWPLLWLAALLAGIGAGAIDAGVNTFAARAFSPRVVNWLHGCWGVGATIGPVVMTAAIATHHGWRLGYGIVAAMIAGLTLIFLATLPLWRAGDPPAIKASAAPPVGTLEALRHPIVRAHVVYFFAYTGIEAGAGAWLFTLLTESRGASVALAGGVVATYWASLTIGRFGFGQAAAKIGPSRVLRLGILGAIVGILLVARPLPIAANVVGIALLGLSLAPLFPTTISLTPARVGSRLAARAVGLQIAAAGLGIAIVPALVGLAAGKLGIEVLPPTLLAFAIVLLCIDAFVRRRTEGDGLTLAPALLAEA